MAIQEINLQNNRRKRIYFAVSCRPQLLRNKSFLRSFSDDNNTKNSLSMRQFTGGVILGNPKKNNNKKIIKNKNNTKNPKKNWIEFNRINRIEVTGNKRFVTIS